MEGFGNDNTYYPHPCCRHHDRAVTGSWLASLHDGKPGTRQVSQGASYLARHQPLLDVRGSARAFATTRTRGGARVFPTTRTGGRARAFPPTRTRGGARAFPTTRTRGGARAFPATRNR
jgi:hypothetical protein